MPSSVNSIGKYTISTFKTFVPINWISLIGAIKAICRYG